jgi:hypothetical protein
VSEAMGNTQPGVLPASCIKRNHFASSICKLHKCQVSGESATQSNHIHCSSLQKQQTRCTIPHRNIRQLQVTRTSASTPCTVLVLKLLGSC